jgi:hypothetical protein
VLCDSKNISTSRHLPPSRRLCKSGYINSSFPLLYFLPRNISRYSSNFQKVDHSCQIGEWAKSVCEGTHVCFPCFFSVQNAMMRWNMEMRGVIVENADEYSKIRYIQKAHKTANMSHADPSSRYIRSLALSRCSSLQHTLTFVSKKEWQALWWVLTLEKDTDKHMSFSAFLSPFFKIPQRDQNGDVCWCSKWLCTSKTTNL